MDRLDYGGFLFFDATYAEFSVLIQGGNNIYQEDMSYSSVPLPGGGTGTGSELYFGFSLIGKYPFTINEKISWFPMLGITYQIALIQRRRPDDGGGVEYDRSKGQSFADMDKYNNPYPLSAWNFFMINVGAGLDYHLTKALFARGEFLFGFRLPTDYELGALEKVKSQMGVNDLQMAGLTGGPTLKFGIGYRFK
jgi:opacity protein-like surface antigen